MHPKLKEVIESGDVNLLHSFIGANGMFDHQDNSMHLAVLQGNTHAVLELMSMEPSSARQLNRQGLTPLHIALINRRDDLALTIAQISPQLIRIPGNNGITPLHCAVKEGNIETVKGLLLICPHAIEDSTVYEETSLHIALNNNRVDVFNLLLKRLKGACYLGSEEQECKILNAQDDIHRDTALHIAASTGRIEVVRTLLANGAQNNLKNSQNLTPIDVAVNAQVRAVFNERFMGITWPTTGGLWETTKDTFIACLMRFRATMNSDINIVLGILGIFSLTMALQAPFKDP